MLFDSFLIKENDLNVSAEQWRVLSSNEKLRWEEEARKDKVRYAQGKLNKVDTVLVSIHLSSHFSTTSSSREDGLRPNT